MPTFYNFTDNGENLVSYSTYNASAWTNVFPAGATLTTGISAPDGSNNAIRFTCNNTTNALLRVTIPSLTPNGTDTYTTSFFVKKVSGTGPASTDLGDGNPSVDYSSQLITGQWVRITVSGVPTATAKTWLDLFSDNNTNYTLDFWGVQLEKKSSVGAYVATNGTIVPGGGGQVYSFDDVFVPADAFRQGNLWSWGSNGGDNTSTIRYTPVTTFSGGTNWKQVASGYKRTAAVKIDGTLWIWGTNDQGQLGNNTSTTRSTPVTTFAGGTNWKQVACGYYHTAAVKTDGTLWMWGFGYFGQTGGVNSNDLTPITGTAGGTNWKQVACGGFHTAAIKTDGTLWSWGYNYYGQLGSNDTSPRNFPLTTFGGGTNWKQVACGANHTAAIKTDGTLWTWGDNLYCQLGNNNVSLGDPLMGLLYIQTPITTFAGGTNWKQVSCGGAQIAAIKTDATLWTWGGNSWGQLGVNDTDNRSTPITTFAGGTNWKQVDCGKFHTSAVKTDATLWTWGGNGNGQLGNNTTVTRSTPITTFAGGTNWKQVASGGYHTAAIIYLDDYM